jgi:hypothetical protein
MAVFATGAISELNEEYFCITVLTKLRNIKFGVIKTNISVDNLLGIQLALSRRSCYRPQNH